MGIFRAAASTTDITPTPGTWMTGFGGRTEPARGVHDPITARAVLLDDGDARLSVVSCDLLGFEPAAVSRMRREIAALSTIPENGVLICCTHTHSGPASMPMRGAMGHVDVEWLAEAQSKIVELVSDLAPRLEPAQLAYACTSVSGIAYNRQDEEHPVDEELIAIGVDSESGMPIATLVNYALHPVVLGQGNLEFSADFPGVVVQRLEEARGGLGLYMQGASGDVDPIVHRDRGWSTGTYEDASEIGEALAAAALDALSEARATPDVTLASSSKSVEIPLDPPPPPGAAVELRRRYEDDRRKALADPQDPAAEAVANAMLEWSGELERAAAQSGVPRAIRAEILVAAINDVRLVGLPFETYSDIALRIKHALEPLQVVLVGCANGLYGYCASRWAKDQGGYGPDTSCRWFSGLLTPVASGADELLTKECATLGKSI